MGGWAAAWTGGWLYGLHAMLFYTILVPASKHQTNEILPHSCYVLVFTDSHACVLTECGGLVGLDRIQPDAGLFVH